METLARSRKHVSSQETVRAVLSGRRSRGDLPETLSSLFHTLRVIAHFVTCLLRNWCFPWNNFVNCVSSRQKLKGRMALLVRRIPLGLCTIISIIRLLLKWSFHSQLFWIAQWPYFYAFVISVAILISYKYTHGAERTRNSTRFILSINFCLSLSLSLFFTFSYRLSLSLRKERFSLFVWNHRKAVWLRVQLVFLCEHYHKDFQLPAALFSFFFALLPSFTFFFTASPIFIISIGIFIFRELEDQTVFSFCKSASLTYFSSDRSRMYLDRFTHPRKSKIYSSSQLQDLFVPPRGSSSLTTRPSYPIKVPVDCTPEDHRLGILFLSPGTRRLSKLPLKPADKNRYRPTFGQGNILLPTRQSTKR